MAGHFEFKIWKIQPRYVILQMNLTFEYVFKAGCQSLCLSEEM